MGSLTKRERAVASKYRKFLRATARAERFYEEAGRHVFSIAQKLNGVHGSTIRIAVDGKGILLLDNYIAAVTNPKRGPKEMPKAWAHGSVKQFQLKEINLFAEEISP